MSEREKMAARNSNFCYLLNALYPVGSIYVSKDPTDPSELFGGSWKRIKEKFIWAIGDNENPGDTGGEKTHTLTEAGQSLLALATNYPTTSVISDIDLNLTYRADTKNYIDNKFAALTALTLEG